MVSTRTPLAGTVLAVLTLFAWRARAQPADAPQSAPSSAGVPAIAVTTAPAAIAAVHHAPVSVARPHAPLDVSADIVHPDLVKRALLVYRVGGELREVPFLRSGEGYVARVPADDVAPPGLAYTIELEGVDGRRTSAFASRASMFDVQVTEDLDDVRERALLARVDGNRSVVVASFDYVGYGRTTGEAAPGAASSSVRDFYLRSEASYSYRPLRTVVEFGIRTGLVRGKSPVGGPDGSNVGLNYAAPHALFRLADLWHLEVSALTSVTEVGFSTGIGGALHVGDPYGSKLVLAFDSVKTFGTRGWARLDIARGRLRVSPVVEVGDIPNARVGVRLFTEVAYLFRAGWSFSGRVGYAAREFDSGGLGGGVALGYAF